MCKAKKVSLEKLFDSFLNACKGFFVYISVKVVHRFQHCHYRSSSVRCLRISFAASKVHFRILCRVLGTMSRAGRIPDT